MDIKRLGMIFLVLSLSFFNSCKNSEEIKMENQTNIIFLHHSTGLRIWSGDLSKIQRKLGFFDGDVEKWFNKYKQKNSKNYNITEMNFPKKEPYGWNNSPFDYYNIWVKNAGVNPYKEEPTLEILTKKYDVIIFKHCFPVSSIQADSVSIDINSDIKTLANYKLQYNALKKKLLEFPETKFIVWTPTALLESHTNKVVAERANEFSEWVKSVWDTKGDNIFLWDFRELQVEGGLFFKNEYAASPSDSHPGREFSKRVAPYFCKRIVEVIQGKGDKTSLTGK
jgi:hypothetical protein